MERPVIGIVSRLDIQKGIDLIIPILSELIESLKVGLVILGTGDGQLQQRFNGPSSPTRAHSHSFSALTKNWPDGFWPAPICFWFPPAMNPAA